MKEIPLTKGAVAIVDDEDFALLTRYKWQLDGKGYAVCSAPDEFGIRRNTRMHRVILGLKRGDPRKGDHRDNNRLNNIRRNLRIATQLQNNRNRVMPKNNTSGFKGASFNANAKKWQVNINADGKTHYFGIFDTPELANYVYKHAAKALHGEFANDGTGVSELTREAATVPSGWKLVPLERSYDMRVKALIAFNTAEQSGNDRDDALDAAHLAMLAAAPASAADDSKVTSDMRDAYIGAHEDLAIWKKRALGAEELNRKFVAAISGPTHMGEPVIASQSGYTGCDHNYVSGQCTACGCVSIGE